ncbi:MAG: SPASM domain-containing protein, partial [Muribaculaceae bacterium]|nr:SPASM domain-containing protein [Muribaculaceae bacterium]
TQACNLCCPYCFEGNKNPISMSNDVEEALIKYISSRPIKTYSITWFGGEPLLRPDIIKSILEKLSLIKGITLTNHNIITNGTLLNHKVYDLFHRFPLDSIQITLDGIKESHDKLRCDRNGMGSYDLIKKNLFDFIAEFPQTHVSIRVNVNKENASDFIDIHRNVAAWFKGKKVSYNVYPGIIKKVEDNIISNGCLDRLEQQEFYLNLHSNGIKFHGFPKNQTGGCTATSAMSLVVGANGHIYKCWEDVGRENLTVGSVLMENQGNQDILADYLINGSKFSNEECKSCSYLPICSGGCPKDRILNKNIKPHQCSIYSINEGKLVKTILKECVSRNKF